MNLFNKANEVTIEGNISQLDIKSSSTGNFGTINVAVDNGYKDKQSGNWIEETAFIPVKVGDKILSKFKGNINKGDRIRFSGKLVMETWADKDTNAKKSALKVQALRVELHIPAAVKDLLKQNGFINTQNQQPAQQQQGGYQPAQQQQGGYQPAQQQQGGYQPAQQQQGGYQPQQSNGYQRQGNPMGNQRPS